MRVFIIFPIFLVLFAGCETNAHRYQRALAEIRLRIKAVPVGQPVSQTNADILASTYWQRYCSPCGAVYPVRDDGRCWAAEVVAGAIPGQKPDILVEKTTGYISWNGGPTVTNWSQLWQ